MNVFAFLAEPASYTVDRNLKVYVPMGIDYCYLLGNSEAKNTREEKVKDVLVHFSKGNSGNIYDVCLESMIRSYLMDIQVCLF